MKQNNLKKSKYLNKSIFYRFDKVANFKQDIDKNSFKKNMGILGLKSAF